MTLTDEDIGKIAALLKPVEKRINDLEDKVERGFDEMRTNFDALFKRDETRHQELIALGHRVGELEKKVA